MPETEKAVEPSLEEQLKIKQARYDHLQQGGLLNADMAYKDSIEEGEKLEKEILALRTEIAKQDLLRQQKSSDTVH